MPPVAQIKSIRSDNSFLFYLLIQVIVLLLITLSRAIIKCLNRRKGQNGHNKQTNQVHVSNQFSPTLQGFPRGELNNSFNIRDTSRFGPQSGVHATSENSYHRYDELPVYEANATADLNCASNINQYATDEPLPEYPPPTYHSETQRSDELNDHDMNRNISLSGTNSDMPSVVIRS
ncbi:hypothetical protein CANARDRAFT_26644 [[Candida] arabinofermentans NRRL YB-2248]|uniref:Uncharacterized protein n=1 Tax=[Candida] arabinofermentans NRRL YB-2248 TaxID=983967 RepID=A0A1E4T668_9ASCO|nr:hypothetical protein CANARDRAFT_26644 [[Candida] arabinofermentans NRRL YB-2248]